MTNASGQAQTTWTLGTSAGSQTANATVEHTPRSIVCRDGDGRRTRERSEAGGRRTDGG